MTAVLSSMLTPIANSPAPLIVTLVIASTLLVIIGATLRRFRVQGNLTVSRASTGAAVASLILATSLFASASLGAPTSDTSVKPPVGTPLHTVIVSPASHRVPAWNDVPPSGDFQPIPLDDLEGYQLPTE